RRDAATIARFTKPNGDEVFIANRAFDDDAGNRKYRGAAPKPTRAYEGKLRLARTGSTLSYQVAEHDSNVFRELYETELGTDDIAQVRFAADSGASQTLVDVRFKSIHIRSEAFGAARPLPEPEEWSWWYIALGIVPLGGVAFWL